ncbi:Rrp15p-domain-containing protein [Multifurca ochricompacta]|uniref:Rrp15p-domain-containing protein n=1 Tax=Multifurca ochricompacta TaxID=376703 RepID=A0AAD4QTY8_9AGAM|nr:Rrp15p-domain-containing protein [Multifurca ochricompacta]
MLPTKRQKRSHETHIRTASLSDTAGESHESDSQNGYSTSEISNSVKSNQSPDTEDEIAEARLVKSKKTLKRRRRATDPSNFGATLQSLLKTDAPSGLPLSLKPSVARKRNDEKLELKAKKFLKGEKKSNEEIGRIKDVIGGWGGESERTLRKVAQRGVVKLFNAIQQSQERVVAAEKETKEARGSGKPTLPAPSFGKRSRTTKKGKNNDNPLGRGKECKRVRVKSRYLWLINCYAVALDKDNFIDMIRSGGIVSKS